MANGRGSEKDTSWRDGKQFAMIPFHALKSAAYLKLSHPAKGLILDLAVQLGRNAANNGKLLCTEKFMNKRGWKGKDTLSRAKKELIEAGLLYETVKGHRPNKASWYAFTFFGLDMNFRHLYDAGAVGGFRRGMYDKEPLIKNATLSPPAILQKPRIAPSNMVEGTCFAPHQGAIRPLLSTCSTPLNGHLLDMPSVWGTNSEKKTDQP